MDIIAVGSSMQDICFVPVDKSLFSGEFHNYDYWEATTGGDAINVATACARIGMNVGCITKVGDDVFGHNIIRIGKEAHVDMSHSVISKEMKSTLSIHMLDGKGGRHSTFNLCRNDMLREADINYDYLKTAKLVHYGSIHLVPGMDGEGVATMFKKCREMGVLTSIDLSGSYDIFGHGKESSFNKIKEALPYTDYFLPSEDEIVDLTGKKTCEEFVEFFRPYGMKMMLVKLGPKGCFVSDFQKSRYIPTFPVEVAIDTIGCGDSFCAAFLSGISWGWSIFEAAVFANAVGTMNCQVVGATLGVRPKAEVMAFIRERIHEVPEDLRARFV